MLNTSMETAATGHSGNTSPRKRQRSRSTKASVGNSKKFSQQEKKFLAKKRTPYCSPVNDANIMADLNNLHQCCAKGGELGCIQNYFSSLNTEQRLEVDYNAAVFKIIECRQVTSSATKSKEELDRFVQEIFRKCIEKEIVTADSSVHFCMSYMIEGRIKVCKKAFALAYGITVKHLERCSKALKLSSTRRVSAISLRKYTDATVHDLTYRETEDLFYETCQLSRVTLDYRVNKFLD